MGMRHQRWIQAVFKSLMLPSFCFGQAGADQVFCAACDIKVVLDTENRLDSLSERDFLCFIDTFDGGCTDHIEYLETSNAVLFHVLLQYPEYFIALIDSGDRPEKVEQVLTNLADPVNDGLPVAACIGSVEKAEGPLVVKAPILAALRTARSKDH